VLQQVLFLALRMQLDGIVPQIMSLPPHMLEEKPSDPVSGKAWGYPPTYFMHMELDRATAQRVTADVTVLKHMQVRVAEIGASKQDVRFTAEL
jgi:hypothetical protein